MLLASHRKHYLGEAALPSGFWSRFFFSVSSSFPRLLVRDDSWFLVLRFFSTAVYIHSILLRSDMTIIYNIYPTVSETQLHLRLVLYKRRLLRAIRSIHGQSSIVVDRPSLRSVLRHFWKSPVACSENSRLLYTLSSCPSDLLFFCLGLCVLPPPRIFHHSFIFYIFRRKYRKCCIFYIWLSVFHRPYSRIILLNE